MNKPKKVGIVGFGKMGMLHGALINKIEGFEVSAITETSKITLNAVKSLIPQIKYFSSYQEMLGNVDLDAIIITTPSFSHVPIALSAIEKNIHLFIEKPLSNSLENALILENALKGKQIAAIAGFHMRYIPTFMKGKQLLAEGIIGEVKHVDSESYVSDIFSPQKGWRYNPEMSGGGVVIDFAVHLLDLMHWYFGKVVSVDGRIKKIYSKMVEDEASAELFFENGISASITSSWSVPGYRLPYLSMNIVGEKGKMKINDHNITVFDNNDLVVKKLNMADLYTGYYFDIGGPHYSLQIQAFAKAVSLNKEAGNISEAVYAQRLVDAIYRSANRGTHENL